MIAASRDAGMKTAIIKQVQLTWQFGWDDYNYFVGGAGLVKEYGCWGITESWAGKPSNCLHVHYLTLKMVPCTRRKDC